MFEEQAKQELFEIVKAFHACKQEDGQSHRKTIAELHAMLKLHEKGIPKKAGTLGILAVREGKIEKDKKKPQGEKGKDKGKNKLAYAPKPKIPPPLKRERTSGKGLCLPLLQGGCGSHICNTSQGLREIGKLKHGALSLCGIVSQLTPPYTPQHNGVSERRNQTLLDMVRSMMNLTTLPKSFWGYALESAARILNMISTKKVERTPYEIWHGKAPKLSYLRVWGCEALVKRDALDKLDPRSIKCIFVGYPKEIIGYYFYYPPENKIFISRNTEFFENSLILQEASRSHRLLKRNRYGFYADVEEHELGDLNEPPNYKAALSDLEYNKWLEAMNTKMQSMKDNQVWILVELPPNARLVAKGYTKTYDVDYGETFSPVANIRAISILLAIAAFYDYEIWQMDVKTAFLNGHLSEDIYMVQPESKYLGVGIKGLIKKIGFTRNPDKPCVYLKASRSNVAFLILYVDDILLMGNNVTML
ncbi:retrotransposon protein, putative, ty1-copia subclass [Tanacetum coccineum]